MYVAYPKDDTDFIVCSFLENSIGHKRVKKHVSLSFNQLSRLKNTLYSTGSIWAKQKIFQYVFKTLNA